MERWGGGILWGTRAEENQPKYCFSSSYPSSPIDHLLNGLSPREEIMLI